MVVTAKVAVGTVAEVYAETPGREWLEAVIDELVMIHRAGLTHGDPRTRNFLATRPRVTAFDLPSWSRRTRRSQVRDLVRCLGSVTKLVGETEVSDRLLFRYEESFGSLPAPADELCTRILEYSCSKDRP
jgi:tRNA A-37 threonylcarbamoyl transferase component Bud32